MSVLATTSAKTYFEEVVVATLERHGLQPDGATTAYLVTLLCDYIKLSPNRLDEPLALILAQARLSRGARRFRQLKRVGDQSLYVSGFFRDHLRRRRLDISYFRAIGGTAYRRLSRLVSHHGRSRLARVYRQLADEFVPFVEVLTDVQLQGQGQDMDVGALFERWLATRSKAVASHLRRAGVELPEGPEGKRN